ncbi:DUF1722 domain-containing protein [Alicyclobacillus ferrooxydans]|uniref:DUF1722 domain-containing protein n=1 Tax=Alicyclobacillus ferrooxydans TaxID=471514 RepID=A0A0P9CH71_9BACL|nr:DUF1722 domain-containing protein [Alicyclobacillus ferrooxydans]KPV42395.1 hypothetical protein AN477_17450 [Alicyclobacillus ferrooxydans]
MEASGSETRVELLYKGCEAFWRDVKYAVMARNYRFVKELSAELRKAGEEASLLHDPLPLYRWLSHVKRIEADPVTNSALRNTAYHLLGYWKRDLSVEERQRLSDRVMTDATSVLSELKARLKEIENAYLETSYIWTDEPWDRAVFMSSGRQWCLQIEGEGECGGGGGVKAEVKVNVKIQVAPMD